MANLGNIFDYREDPDHSKYDGSHGNGGGNHPIKKPPIPMVAYAVIALVVLLFFNSLMLPAIGRMSIEPASYDEFLTELDARNVDQVDLLIPPSSTPSRTNRRPSIRQAVSTISWRWTGSTTPVLILPRISPQRFRPCWCSSSICCP